MNFIDKLASLDDEKKKKLIEKIKSEGDRYGIYPLTPSQYLLWCGYTAGETVIHHSNPGIMVRMKNISRKGVLDVLERLRQMEDPLRYRFIEVMGSHFQYIDDDTPYTVRDSDISAVPGKDREEALHRAAEAFYFRPIDLVNDFPAMFEIVKIEEDEYALLIYIHHIIGDGMTIGVLYRDICSIIAGSDVKSRFQYGHYAMIKTGPEGVENEKRNRDYWVEQIKDMEKYLDEPTDYSRYSDRADNARDVVMHIDDGLDRLINAKAAELGCSAYNVLSSVFSIVLQQYVQKDRLIMATTLFNRDDPRYRDIAGDFASVIPLVFAQEKGMTLDEYILMNTANFKEALRHGDISITNVQQEFPHDRKERVNPLYQIVFVYHNENIAGNLRENINGVELSLKELYDEKRQLHYTLDMCVEINHSAEEGDFIRAHYCQRLFEHATVEGIIHAFVYALGYLERKDVKVEDMVLTDGADYDMEFHLGDLPEGVEETDEDPVFTADGRVAVLGKSMKPLPVNFYGDVYVSSDGRWYRTYKCGRIGFDGRLQIDDRRSDLVPFDGSEVNLAKAREALRSVFSGMRVSFNYLGEDMLILNIWGYEDDIPSEEIYRICGFRPTLVYRTDRGGQEHVLRHQMNIISAGRILEKEGRMWEPVQERGSDNVTIYIRGGGAVRQSLIDDIYAGMMDERTEFVFVSDDGQEYRYPKKAMSETETRISEVWKGVLGNDDFGVYDHFYEVGGNSVKIIMLMKELNESFGTDMKITDLFIYNTVHQQAEYISSVRGDEPEKADVQVMSF